MKTEFTFFGPKWNWDWNPFNNRYLPTLGLLHLPLPTICHTLLKHSYSFSNHQINEHSIPLCTELLRSIIPSRRGSKSLYAQLVWRNQIKRIWYLKCIWKSPFTEDGGLCLWHCFCNETDSLCWIIHAILPQPLESIGISLRDSWLRLWCRLLPQTWTLPNGLLGIFVVVYV